MRLRELRLYGVLRSSVEGSCVRTRPRVTPVVTIVARGWRGQVSLAVDGRRGAVLLIGDVLAPRDGAALIVDLLHRYVGHEAVGGSAVPVVLVGLEEDAVARADHLDGIAAALAES